MVTVLNELAAIGQEGADFLPKIIGYHWTEIEQWQTRYNRADPRAWADMLFEKRIYLKRIASDDVRARKTIAKEVGHFWGLFNGYKAILPESTGEERLGH